MTPRIEGEAAYDRYRAVQYTSNKKLYEYTNGYKDRIILVVENIIYSECIV
jgi:hypothetical protein